MVRGHLGVVFAKNYDAARKKGRKLAREQGYTATKIKYSLKQRSGKAPNYEYKKGYDVFARTRKK